MKRFALALIIVLAIIGIIGYSIKSSGSPIKVLFKTKGGIVIFDHRIHSSKNEYNIKCQMCHHNMEDEKSALGWKCRICHGPGKECDLCCEDDPVHKQCIGSNCINCHKQEGMDASDCNLCHQ